MSTTATNAGVRSAFDRYFEVSTRGSTMSREIRGGFATFFTMAYIVVLNPLILGSAADGGGAKLPLAEDTLRIYDEAAKEGWGRKDGANLPAYKLTLFRNRLNGELDLAITVAADGVETDTSRPLVLAFGGEAPETFDFATDLETRYNTVNQFFIADPARKTALIERMKERNSLLLTVPLTGGTTASKEVWLSLRGVIASLDFMATYARKVAQY